jgi:hypothetical protein
MGYRIWDIGYGIWDMGYGIWVVYELGIMGAYGCIWMHMGAWEIWEI